MIRYTKLFEMLSQRGMKLSDLRKIISSATVAKLKKGEYISGEVIEKICLFLDCQPGDIMEVLRDDESKKETQFAKAVRMMAEPLYLYIKAEAEKNDCGVEEQWEKYLQFANPSKKEKEDFAVVQRYIETRIAEDMQK